MKKPKPETESLLVFERMLWEQGFSRVMGLDEVGRGCLAGPVVAAGVILDPERPIEGLFDSKQLSEAERDRLDPEIREKALFWVVKEGTVHEIDTINILKASMKAMHRCVEAAEPMPDYLLVDGNHFPSMLIPHQCLVKGDSRAASIAAASIVAKVFRDRLMRELAELFPGYGWERNAGYPTAEHREAIRQLGLTPWHRRSFRSGL